MTDEKKIELAKRKELANKLKKAEKAARVKAIKNRKPFKGLQIRPTVSLFDDADRQEPGEKNWKGFGFDIHPQVTIVSTILLVLFISATLIFPGRAEETFSAIMSGITKNAGWFLIAVANVFVVAALYFAFGRYGKIKIGGPEAQPEFTKSAWYAMLLSAGTGIGLIFWSVAEPISHLYSPMPMFGGLTPGSPEAAQAAMAVSFFAMTVRRSAPGLLLSYIRSAAGLLASLLPVIISNSGCT